MCGMNFFFDESAWRHSQNHLLACVLAHTTEHSGVRTAAARAGGYMSTEHLNFKS